MKWPETSLSRRAVYIIKFNIIEKLIIAHQELIEGIKVWILPGYTSNILGYPSKYCNYTSKKKLGGFPHKNGLYTCIISVLTNNKLAIYKFCIFEFSILLFSKLSILACGTRHISPQYAPHPRAAISPLLTTRNLHSLITYMLYVLHIIYYHI